MTDLQNNPSYLFQTCFSVLEGNYGALMQALGIMGFVLIFNFFFKAVLLKLRNRYLKQQKIVKLSFVSALHKPLSYYVWFLATAAALDLVNDYLFKFKHFEIHTLLSVGAVIAFSWFLLRWNSKLLHAMIEFSQTHQTKWTPAKLDLISKLGTIATFVITIFLLMDVTGRNMQTLIAFGGIGGVALAFASQQVISNFFGGLMIYLTHPFTIGEWVNIPDRKIEGHIEEIGWYMTRIRGFDKRPIYVPNSIFTQLIVITPSRMTHQQIKETIGLRYQDATLIKTITDNVRSMLYTLPYIDKQLAVNVYLVRFGSFSLDIEISAYISTSAGVKFEAAKQEVLLKIASLVEQQGAEIAPPKQLLEIPSHIKVQHSGTDMIPMIN